MKLDIYVSQKLKLSRSYAKNLIKAGKILVNEKIVWDHNLEIKEAKIKVFNPIPEIPILYNCKDFLIVYKPYNMSVCRSITTPKAEFVLNELLARQFDLSPAEKKWEFGLVNRIDKLTEGLILLTKSSEAYLYFKNTFKNQKMKKYYRAYYEPIYPELNFKYFICPHKQHCFTLEKECFCETKFHQQELIIKENNSIKRCITGLKKEEGYYLCELVTGRTHQIRRTMLSIERPIWGDPQYGIKQERMFLFSTSLVINEIF